MKVARVNLDLTRKTYSLYNDDDLKVVRKAIVKGSQIEVTHHYEGHQPYETFKDSIDIPPLQNGLYLVEFFTEYLHWGPGYFDLLNERMEVWKNAE